MYICTLKMLFQDTSTHIEVLLRNGQCSWKYLSVFSEAYNEAKHFLQYHQHDMISWHIVTHWNIIWKSRTLYSVYLCITQTSRKLESVKPKWTHGENKYWSDLDWNQESCCEAMWPYHQTDTLRHLGPQRFLWKNFCLHGKRASTTVLWIYLNMHLVCLCHLWLEIVYAASGVTYGSLKHPE